MSMNQSKLSPCGLLTTALPKELQKYERKKKTTTTKVTMDFFLTDFFVHTQHKENYWNRNDLAYTDFLQLQDHNT